MPPGAGSYAVPQPSESSVKRLFVLLPHTNHIAGLFNRRIGGDFASLRFAAVTTNVDLAVYVELVAGTAGQMDIAGPS